MRLRCLSWCITYANWDGRKYFFSKWKETDNSGENGALGGQTEWPHAKRGNRRVSSFIILNFCSHTKWWNWRDCMSQTAKRNLLMNAVDVRSNRYSNTRSLIGSFIPLFYRFVLLTKLSKKWNLRLFCYLAMRLNAIQ